MQGRSSIVPASTRARGPGCSTAPVEGSGPRLFHRPWSTQRMGGLHGPSRARLSAAGSALPDGTLRCRTFIPVPPLATPPEGAAGASPMPRRIHLSAARWRDSALLSKRAPYDQDLLASSDFWSTHAAQSPLLPLPPCENPGTSPPLGMSHPRHQESRGCCSSLMGRRSAVARLPGTCGRMSVARESSASTVINPASPKSWMEAGTRPRGGRMHRLAAGQGFGAGSAATPPSASPASRSSVPPAAASRQIPEAAAAPAK